MNARKVLKTALNWRTLSLTMVLCAMIAVPPVVAQNYGDQGSTQGKQQQADFSKQELQQFVTAKAEVDQIRSDFSEELQGVEDSKKARQLQDKYTQKMVDAVQDTGMSVQEYNEISRAAQTNPDVGEKIEKMMD